MLPLIFGQLSEGKLNLAAAVTSHSSIDGAGTQT
jgi:hypothetical protein